MNDFFQNIFKSFTEKFSENITDRIFSHIEERCELLESYRALVGLHGQSDVNRRLGRAIREHYRLTNLGRSYQTQSSLIQSYERHGRI